ncbi:hypothetical protein RHMOL_Rhmol10G0304000 [Rhododendron molle]|uniref:Uncharacterized protein n=1 Tax=Rhododendron molle TaxID=49168 RepID=A0ACC0M966_RHOML|nr:hypothetical protein RHMOL_Rhmol10G0304000 [Rhododendron molle]
MKWTTTQYEHSLDRKEAIALTNTVATICWHIWKARNDFIFNNHALNPLATVSNIMFSRVESGEAFPPNSQSQTLNSSEQGGSITGLLLKRDLLKPTAMLL